MITVKDQDFEMEQVKNLPFFDLKMPVVINEGKDNERTEMKITGHAMPFEACIKEVIAYRLNKSDKVYSISEYVHEYQQEVEKICSLIEFHEPVSKKKKNSQEETEDDDDNDDVTEEVE